MGAEIYILKMIIAGCDFYSTSTSQQQGMIDLAFFIIYVYACYWFAMPVPTDAPFLTLNLWKDLKRWAARDPVLSSACIRKLDMHT